MLNDSIEKAKFGEYNRHLGAILGFVKGVVICLLLTFFIVTVSEEARAVLKDSRSGMAAAVIMDRLHPVMPEKLHDALDEYIHQLDSEDLPLEYADHEHDHAGHDHAGEGSEPVEELPPELEQLVARLPAEMQSEFRQAMLRSLNEAETGSRPRLEDQLLSALRSLDSNDDATSLWNTLQQPPDQLLSGLNDWLTGASPAGEADPAAAERRQQLLVDIAGRFSTTSRGQAMIRQDIESQLQPLTDEAALALLEDWRADLLRMPDPNPATSIATPLSERIARYLTQARAGGGELR
jgi:membrane protein required for colicin V production